jgi:hypothetical protein
MFLPLVAQADPSAALEALPLDGGAAGGAAGGGLLGVIAGAAPLWWTIRRLETRIDKLQEESQERALVRAERDAQVRADLRIVTAALEQVKALVGGGR